MNFFKILFLVCLLSFSQNRVLYLGHATARQKTTAWFLKDNDCTVKTSPCTKWQEVISNSVDGDDIHVIFDGQPYMIVDPSELPLVIKHSLTIQSDDSKNRPLVVRLFESPFFQLDDSKGDVHFTLKRLMINTQYAGIFIAPVSSSCHNCTVTLENNVMFNLIDTIVKGPFNHINVISSSLQVVNYPKVQYLFDVVDTSIISLYSTFDNAQGVFSLHGSFINMNISIFTNCKLSIIKAYEVTINEYNNTYSNNKDTHEVYDSYLSMISNVFNNNGYINVNSGSTSRFFSTYMDGTGMAISGSKVEILYPNFGPGAFFYVSDFSVVTISHATFSGYTFTSILTASQSNITFLHTNILGNGMFSAPLYFENDSYVWIKNCVMNENHNSNGEGGVIYFSGAELQIIDTMILNNVAMFGGAIFVSWKKGTIVPVVRVKSGTAIRGNKANFAGGGIFFDLQDVKLRIEGGKVNNNTAVWYGNDFSSEPINNRYGYVTELPKKTQLFTRFDFHVILRDFFGHNVLNTQKLIYVRPAVVCENHPLYFDSDILNYTMVYGLNTTVHNAQVYFKQIYISGFFNSFEEAVNVTMHLYYSPDKNHDQLFTFQTEIRERSNIEILYLLPPAFVVYVLFYVLFEVIYFVYNLMRKDEYVRLK